MITVTDFPFPHSSTFLGLESNVGDPSAGGRDLCTRLVGGLRITRAKYCSRCNSPSSVVSEGWLPLKLGSPWKDLEGVAKQLRLQEHLCGGCCATWHFIYLFFITVSLTYTLTKVSHEKHCGYYIHPYNQVLPRPHWSHCPSVGQDATESLPVFPVTPPPHKPCVAIIILLNPLLPPSPLILPHTSSLLTASPFLESVSLLLFCSFSFSLLLYSSNEGNHLVLVFSAWLISLSIIPSSSIHVVANGRICFLLMVE